MASRDVPGKRVITRPLFAFGQHPVFDTSSAQGKRRVDAEVIGRKHLREVTECIRDLIPRQYDGQGALADLNTVDQFESIEL